MTTIRSFTKTSDGFTGTLRTLTLNVKIKITAVPKDNEKAPDYRVYVGAMEIGAAWKRQTAAKRDYLSLKIDDPAFPAAVSARLPCARLMITCDAATLSDERLEFVTEEMNKLADAIRDATIQKIDGAIACGRSPAGAVFMSHRAATALAESAQLRHAINHALD